MAAYIVHNNNALGYSENYAPDKAFCSMIVMAVDYMAGGEPTTIDRQVSVNIANTRIATREDFERFRLVVWHN